MPGPMKTRGRPRTSDPHFIPRKTYLTPTIDAKLVTIAAVKHQPPAAVLREAFEQYAQRFDDDAQGYRPPIAVAPMAGVRRLA